MRYISRMLAAATAMALTAPAQAAPGQKPLATIFKNPQCSCCEAYGAYLKQSGYPVKIVTTHDGPLIRQRQGLSPQLEGCHTTLVGGYFVEGHVPAEYVDRLLDERPNINGISIPGMPPGTPGMGGPKPENLKVFALAPGGKQSVYAVD